MRKLHERETDLLKFELSKDGFYYTVNAWGRSSKRGVWRQVWINRVYISYGKAYNEYHDTGQALYDWKNQLNISMMAA